MGLDWFNLSCQREKKEKGGKYELRAIFKAEKEEEKRLARVGEERFVNTCKSVYCTLDCAALAIGS